MNIFQMNIFEMAKEAGFETEKWFDGNHVIVYEYGAEIDITEELERFVALVAAHEREACAKLNLRSVVMSKRPPNCGTSYCSCIECIYGKDGCVADEEQCNDGCLAQKSAIADALKLANDLDAEFFQGRISNHNGRKAAQTIRMLIDAPVQPVKQEPVSIPDHITCPFCESHHVPYWLHDLKLDAKAIRAEALEDRNQVLQNEIAMLKGMLETCRAEALEEAYKAIECCAYYGNDKGIERDVFVWNKAVSYCAAAIRWLK